MRKVYVNTEPSGVDVAINCDNTQYYEPPAAYPTFIEAHLDYILYASDALTTTNGTDYMGMSNCRWYVYHTANWMGIGSNYRWYITIEAFQDATSLFSLVIANGTIGGTSWNLDVLKITYDTITMSWYYADTVRTSLTLLNEAEKTPVFSTTGSTWNNKYYGQFIGTIIPRVPVSIDIY